MEGGVLLCAGEGNTTSFKSLSYGDFLNRRFMVSCVSLAPYGVFLGTQGIVQWQSLRTEGIMAEQAPVDGRGAWISLEFVLICSSSRGRSVCLICVFLCLISIMGAQRLEKISKAESNLWLILTLSARPVFVGEKS